MSKKARKPQRAGSRPTQYPRIRWAPNFNVADLGGKWLPVPVNPTTAATMYADNGASLPLSPKVLALARPAAEQFGVHWLSVYLAMRGVAAHVYSDDAISPPMVLVGSRVHVNAVLAACEAAVEADKYPHIGVSAMVLPMVKGLSFLLPLDKADDLSQSAFNVVLQNKTRLPVTLNLPPTFKLPNDHCPHTDPDLVLDINEKHSEFTDNETGRRLLELSSTRFFAPYVAYLAQDNNVSAAPLAALLAALAVYAETDSEVHVRIEGDQTEALFLCTIAAVAFNIAPEALEGLEEFSGE